MIDYKKIREDIQIQINSEEVKNKITSDLNIKLNKLDTFASNDLDKVEILENSIMNCWQGVFELKNKKVPTKVDTKNNNLVNPSICNSRRKYSQKCDIG